MHKEKKKKKKKKRKFRNKLRTYSLPRPSFLGDWTNSVDCEPRFFNDVFSETLQYHNRKQ